MAVQKMHVIVQKKQVAFVDNGPQYQTGRCGSDNEKYLSIPPPHEPTNPKLHMAWMRATVAAWAVRNGYRSVTAERATELLQVYQALAGHRGSWARLRGTWKMP